MVVWSPTLPSIGCSCGYCHHDYSHHDYSHYDYSHWSCTCTRCQAGRFHASCAIWNPWDGNKGIRQIAYSTCKLVTLQSNKRTWEKAREQGLGTGSGNMVWEQGLGTGSGSMVWEQGLGTGSGSRVWELGLGPHKAMPHRQMDKQLLNQNWLTWKVPLKLVDIGVCLWSWFT